MQNSKLFYAKRIFRGRCRPTLLTRNCSLCTINRWKVITVKAGRQDAKITAIKWNQSIKMACREIWNSCRFKGGITVLGCSTCTVEKNWPAGESERVEKLRGRVFAPNFNWVNFKLLGARSRVPEIVLRNYLIYPDRGKPVGETVDNRVFCFFSPPRLPERQLLLVVGKLRREADLVTRETTVVTGRKLATTTNETFTLELALRFRNHERGNETPTRYLFLSFSFFYFSFLFSATFCFLCFVTVDVRFRTTRLAGQGRV